MTDRPVLAVQVYYKSVELRWTVTAGDRLGIRRRQPGQSALGGVDVSVAVTHKEQGVKVEGKQPSAEPFAFPLRTSRSRTGNTAQKDLPLYWHPRRALLSKIQSTESSRLGSACVSCTDASFRRLFQKGREACFRRTVTLFPVVRCTRVPRGIISR